MTEPGWQPIADADPVPGEPAAVRALAGRYVRAAEDAGAQSAALRRWEGAATWDGAAADAWAARSSRLPTDLDAMATRLRRVAAALSAFAPALESAQRRARAALARAREAQLSAGVRPGSPPWPGPVLVTTAQSPQDRELGEVIERSRRALAQATQERDQAAAACARALRAAGEDALRDPHGWHRVLSVVSRVAGAVATWLGVAAVVLCWVPGLGPALAAVALTAGAVGLLADLALAGYGDKGWRDLGADALGLVPAGKTVRFAASMPREALQLRALARAALHTRPAADVRLGARQLAAARSRRTMGSFLRSEGGLLDEIARGRELRRHGAALVLGGHSLDAAQAALPLPGVSTGRSGR